jgi:hypothetical protein
MLKYSRSQAHPWFYWIASHSGLYGVVTAIGIALLMVSAQAQTSKISKATISPYQIVPRLDALPQMRMPGAATEVNKPFRYPEDPLTFSQQKSQAKAMRFTPNGAMPGIPLQTPGVPVQMGSGLVPKQSLNLTVPAEIVFNGISNATCAAVNGGSNFRPSDMALAVGDANVGVLQGVNDCLIVFDKSGNQQAGYPKATPTFFNTALNTSDPRMIYDWINHRYYFVVITYPNGCGNGCPGAAFYNLAVSLSDSPNANWCFYQFNVATSPNPNGTGSLRYSLPDFPRLGQDRQAVYLASNLYQNGSYISEEVLALPKAGLMACTTISYTTVTAITQGFTIQPANVFSPGDDPKSMYFVTSFSGTSNSLVVSSLHDPFGTPTFTQTTVTTSNTYSLPPDATQQGSATLIAVGDTRISGSAYYAAGSIYAALSTNGGGGEPAMILYQIQPFVDTSGTANDGKISSARILNEILVGGGSNAWYYPAQVPDQEGNVTTVFGFSSSTFYASLAYMSRRAAQAVGTVPDSGIFAVNGQGPYVTVSPQRWGDYFAAAPAGLVSGGGTGGVPKMWFAGQYASGVSSQWNTAIGRTGYIAINQDTDQQAVK